MKENKKEYQSPLFTAENADSIFVPAVVREDLCNIIEEKLKKAGFYYRISYRVKKSDSILTKMKSKGYGVKGSAYENKKLQDLIGIRIIMYFDDDMAVIRDLLDSLFAQPGEWETTATAAYEFRAMKINGTFKLPEYLSKMIINPELSSVIDDTFEIQVRTNAFEGWHEIEHDLHYKGNAFNDSNESLSRRMNSILATLELCDDSLVKLLEDLGHQHYKDQNWDDMIRCHYRIKFKNEPLAREIIECFDNNTELAKTFFKFDRARLIEALWYRNADPDSGHTVNEAVRIVNELEIKDDHLFEIFANESKRSNQQKRKRFEPFKPLGAFPVFASGVEIETAKLGLDDAFDKAVSYIHTWVKNRLSDVFADFPEDPQNYDGEAPGYRAILEYDHRAKYFREFTTHPDMEVPSRIWMSDASVRQHEGKLIFTVTNKFAEPVEKYRDPQNGLFSRPSFYGEIADNIGIIDVDRMSEGLKTVDKEGLEDLYDLIYSGRRHFPVVVFIVTDKTWADKFDINYFAFLTGYYAHIRVIDDPEIQKHFSSEYNLNPYAYVDSVTVIYPGEAPKTSYKKDIIEASFEVIKYETKKYWNEKGCRAFRRRLISDIREKIVENVDGDVYANGNSFKLAQVEEEWDVVDERGDETGEVIKRADAKNLKAGRFHRVVSIYTVTGDGKVLITRRAISKSHPHRWEVTCGSVLSGETPIEGAVRELLEETGIKKNANELEELYFHADRRRHCVYYGYITFIPTSDIKIILEPDETDEYKFVTAEDFFEFAKSEKFARSESGRLVKFEEIIRKKVNMYHSMTDFKEKS